MRPDYKQSHYGKFTAEELEEIYNSLDPDGESKEYVDALTAQLHLQMKSTYGDQAKMFGLESCRALVLHTMAHIGRLSFQKVAVQ